MPIMAPGQGASGLGPAPSAGGAVTGVSAASGAPAASGAATLPIPGVDQYAQADMLANNAYNNALAQLNNNRLSTLTQYGYTGSVDPTTGVVGGVTVDPHAMTGQLQQLLHSNAVQDQQSRYGVEDRGLVGGLANQPLAENAYQHAASDSQLGTNLLSALSGFDGSQQTAAETRDNTLWQDELGATDAALGAQTSQPIDQLIASLGSYGNTPASTPDSGSYVGGTGGSTSVKQFAPAAKQVAVQKIISDFKGQKMSSAAKAARKAFGSKTPTNHKRKTGRQ